MPYSSSHGIFKLDFQPPSYLLYLQMYRLHLQKPAALYLRYFLISWQVALLNLNMLATSQFIISLSLVSGESTASPWSVTLLCHCPSVRELEPLSFSIRETFQFGFWHCVSDCYYSIIMLLVFFKKRILSNFSV